MSVDGPNIKMTDQTMAADKVRLKGQHGTVNKVDMQTVEDAICVQLDLAK